MSESLIRYNLKDGRSILIPFSKYMKMSDNDFLELDTGFTGRFPTVDDSRLDLESNNTIDFDIEYEDEKPSPDDILYNMEEE